MPTVTKHDELRAFLQAIAEETLEPRPCMVTIRAKVGRALAMLEELREAEILLRRQAKKQGGEEP